MEFVDAIQGLSWFGHRERRTDLDDTMRRLGTFLPELVETALMKAMGAGRSPHGSGTYRPAESAEPGRAMGMGGDELPAWEEDGCPSPTLRLEAGRRAAAIETGNAGSTKPPAEYRGSTVIAGSAGHGTVARAAMRLRQAVAVEAKPPPSPPLHAWRILIVVVHAAAPCVGAAMR